LTVHKKIIKPFHHKGTKDTKKRKEKGGRWRNKKDLGHRFTQMNTDR
jgi:hypothetical protein